MKYKRLACRLLVLALLLALLPSPALAEAGPAGQGEDHVVSTAQSKLGKTGAELGYTYEWCAAFVCWAGRTAGQNFPAGDLGTPKDVAQWFINNEAGVFYGFRADTFASLNLSGQTAKSAAVRTDRASVTPKKGDLVCFLWPEDIEVGYNWSHIGILTEDYSGGMLYTIEGNTGAENSTPGKRTVQRKERVYGASVVGIIRPNYRPGGPAPGVGRKVNHYVGLYGGGFTLADTDTLTVTEATGAVEELQALVRNYEDCGQPDLIYAVGTLQREGDVSLYYPRLYTFIATGGEGAAVTSNPERYAAGTVITVTVQAAPGSQLSWTGAEDVRQNGSTLTLTMPAHDVQLKITAAEKPHVGPFWDVSTEAWYAKSVAAVYELGLMRGTAADAFSPQRGITLAETVALAARLHSANAGAGVSFTAGAGEPWYAPYAAYAEAEGLVWTDCDYSAAATRADFARILGRALPPEELEALWEVPDFADLEDGELDEGIVRLCRAGVLSGEKVDGTAYFRPERPISRAEAAAVVSRMADPSLRLKP